MIYVICANDSLEEATKNKRKVERRLENLAVLDYVAKINNYGSRQTYKEYRKQIYWHIHKVKEF